MFEVHQVKVHILYPRSLTVVNILGSQKCALSLDVPQTWFNNWPETKHVVTLIDNKLVVF